MNLPEDPREEKALKALVAAALHPFDADAEVSEEEVNMFLATCRPLTPEEESHVQRISWNSQKLSVAARTTRPSVPRISTRTEFAAMHREKTDAEPDPKTEAELERKRAEIRERLRKRRENR